MKKYLSLIWNKIKSLFNFLWYKPSVKGPEVKEKEMLKVVNTRQPGPNMPKYQPCPNGHGLKHRIYKTLGGAYYNCVICGDFFVRSRGSNGN